MPNVSPIDRILQDAEKRKWKKVCSFGASQASQSREGSKRPHKLMHCDVAVGLGQFGDLEQPSLILHDSNNIGMNLWMVL